MQRTHLVGLGLMLVACGDDLAPPVPPLQPTAFVDLDPDPGITEVELVAEPAMAEYLPGRSADVWAFRDGASDEPARVPGPLLDVRQGEQVIVHFTNRLPDPTTIHWHGLRVPNGSDGTPSTQAIIPPGGTFDYTFEVVDAGLFWYHPHVAGDVQIERGLYGPVIVRGGALPEVTADRVLMLDDVKLEASGRLSVDTDPLDVMLGRQGNVLLVNGKRDAVLDVVGGRERWRLVNTANGRYFNLRLPSHDFLVIGIDGGLLVEPYRVETLLIAPGERYDVLVDLADAPGEEVALETIHYDRGHSIPDPGPRPLLTLRVGDALAPLASLPSTWGEIAPIPTDEATAVRSFVLSEEEGVAEPSFFINGERWPDVTHLEATKGGIEIWAITNESEMDHPFHLHGMSFQVLGEDGQPAPHLGWKDTVNVPQLATVRFSVRYDAPGMWMYHCHILEHAERGMMGELMVR